MKKLVLEIISGFFTLKAIITIFGIIFTQLGLIWNPLLKIFFDDITFYTTSILIPIALATTYLLIAIYIKKGSQTAWLAALLILTINLFYYPLGTIIAAILITLLITPWTTQHLKPFNKNSTYRIAGLTIFAICIGFFIANTGLAQNIINQITPTPLCIKPAEQKITTLPNTETTGNYIAVLTATTTQAIITQQQTLTIYIQNLGGSIIKQYTKPINAMLIHIDQNKLQTLAANPNIQYIYPDIYLYPVDTTTNQTAQPTSTITQILNVQPLWNMHITGKNIAIAIVDTGINENMKWLQRDGQSIVIAKHEIYADYIHPHGTEIASIIAGQNKTYKGIAPDADLIDIEVAADTDGRMPISAILDGWNWLANWKQQTKKYVICTNSFGIPYDLIQCGGWTNPCPICTAANNMVLKYKIPMIIAAGNKNILYGRHLYCPGQAKYAITVGAIDNNLQATWFTCIGPTSDGNKKPDIVAPGENIPAYDPNGNLVTVCGTSFSTPMVAATIALLAQNNTDYDPQQIKNAIEKSAKDLGPPGYDYTYGYGLIDAYKALQTLQNQTPTITWQTITFTLSLLGVVTTFYPEIRNLKKQII
mgnify:CR=1 FL=1